MIARALAALCVTATFASCDVPAEGVRVVEVNIEHSRFRPARFSFAQGTSVEFVVHNQDPIDHEFIVGDIAVQRRHENGSEGHHGAVAGEVSVPAGEHRTTTYTFSRTGSVLIGCHLPGHYDYGMRGTVVVTP